MKQFFNAYFGLKIVFVLLLIIGGIFGSAFFSSPEVFAGSQHNLSGYAWSDNIGWLSFNSSNCDTDNDGKSNGAAGCPVIGTAIPDYGVNIDSVSGNLTGYAWSDNIGWLKFDAVPYSGESYPETPYYSAKLGIDNKITGWVRACAGTVNSDCNSATRTDGWDGWFRMVDTNYAVIQNTSKTPKELEGWAWGREVLGWLSFNCQNQSVCAISNYKVIVAQGPPKITSLNQTWDHCTIYQTSLPSFAWGYSGDSPQAAYEVRIDNDSQFFDALGNAILDQDEFWCGGQAGQVCTGDGSWAFVPPTSKWANWMKWNAKYWWVMRVKDTTGNWSQWSSPKVFKTPLNAYPWVEFSWVVTQGNPQEVQFNNSSQVFYTPQEPPELMLSPEEGVPVLPGALSFWTFQDAVLATSYLRDLWEPLITFSSNGEVEIPPGASVYWTFQDAVPATSSSWQPLTTFSSTGQKKATLKVTDGRGYFCQGAATLSVGQAGGSASIKRYQFIEF